MGDFFELVIAGFILSDPSKRIWLDFPKTKKQRSFLNLHKTNFVATLPTHVNCGTRHVRLFKKYCS